MITIRERDHGDTSLYDEDTDHFDDFLFTTMCDDFFPNDRYGLDLAPANRSRPHQDDTIMHNIVAHWFLAHPEMTRLRR